MAILYPNPFTMKKYQDLLQKVYDTIHSSSLDTKKELYPLTVEIQEALGIKHLFKDVTFPGYTYDKIVSLHDENELAKEKAKEDSYYESFTKAFCEEDHITEEKVDEVPKEIRLPKMFLPTKSYDIIDCLKDRDEATYRLIKAVNYLLKKQR